jgi:parvulin-like peptidyl-prolyl isomerase
LAILAQVLKGHAMLVARINDEAISADAFVKLLKLNGSLDDLLETALIDKLVVHVAKSRGVTVGTEEIQERADQFRRVLGLHRARDTIEYLDNIDMTIEEFESYVAETLYKDKLQASITNDDAVRNYYRLHLPLFERVELHHIVLDGQAKAQELLAILREEPSSFSDIAKQHSLASDTRENGGYLGKINRGCLPNEVEVKVFKANPGDILGPFLVTGFYEIFYLSDKYAVELDSITTEEVKKRLFHEWLEKQVGDYRIEML